MYARRHHLSGFTLLELVLVLLVIALATAIIAPRLMGFAQGRHSGDVAADILALARYAHSQAIADSTVYRLNIDASGGRYWVSLEDNINGQTAPAKPQNGSRDDIHKLPDGVRIKFTSYDPNAVNQQIQAVHFYADGRTEPGKIEVWDDFSSAVIECPRANQQNGEAANTNMYQIVGAGQ